MPQEYAIRDAKVFDRGGNQMDGWEVIDLKSFNGQTHAVVATILDRDFVRVLEKYLP